MRYYYSYTHFFFTKDASTIRVKIGLVSVDPNSQYLGTVYEEILYNAG